MGSVISWLKNSVLFFVVITMALPAFLSLAGVLMDADSKKDCINALKPMQSQAGIKNGLRYIHKLIENLDYNFVLKKNFIQLHSLVSIHLFNISPSQQVILGEKGWLFYDSSTDGVTMLDYYGRACFSSDELVSMRSNLLRLKDAFGKRNH